MAARLHAMVSPSPTPPTNLRLAKQVREQFVAHACGTLNAMAAAGVERLQVQIEQSHNTRDAQVRRDSLTAFQKLQQTWTQATADAWRKALNPPTDTFRGRFDASTLALLEDDAVENKILSSRLALAVLDKAGEELNELRLRILHLESTREFVTHDVLRPEVMSQLLVEAWGKSGLTREIWLLAQDVLQQQMLETLTEGYLLGNQYLISQGVMPEIDLKSQIRRTAGSVTGTTSTDAAAGRPAASSGAGRADENTVQGGTSQSQGDDNSSPATRSQARAQGLLGQLKRVLGEDRPAADGDYKTTRQHQPSSGLVRALNQPGASEDRSGSGSATGGPSTAPPDSAGVARLASELQHRTQSIKKQATTSSEKATIEIVALMFQSILSEERIPAAVRVWFARLQMPVMRVALFEPEFFGTLHHPARKLIDHMGSCVLGFDSRAISGSALETEIKRVVQVIEQYPDTGRRVFQLVYDEFQKFLSKFLTEKDMARKVVTLAQQVEQKETLAIQNTIEMRNMLNSMPVREEIRDFLFKVWSEVLAVAAIKNGAQHQDTIMLKRAASDLVWAASAKPNRADRARVIHDMPMLLQRLRQGMVLLGYAGAQQEAHIKLIGDTLADAFMSKTESIPQERIDAMAERLSHLEDFIIEDGTGDIPLDAASIEMLVGIDASAIVVVADGGSKPNQAMLAWAQELQPGTWYSINHNGTTKQVQYVWRSDRKQLHLFASVDGRSYLIQARRLAAYLQAGLLVPQEDESLTVRATRDALAKLDANPERILS
ncbi:MAG: hypothetical protein RLZZ401_532 [Pseudomonadota bacterium]